MLLRLNGPIRFRHGMQVDHLADDPALENLSEDGGAIVIVRRGSGSQLNDSSRIVAVASTYALSAG